MPIIIGLIVLIAGLVGVNVALDSKVSQTFPTPTPTIVAVSTHTPTTIPLAPYKSEEYIDPDPIVNCQNPNCGSIKIKKSLCSDTVGYVCCQIGDTWTWYASRNKCKQDQNSYQANNTYITPPERTYPPCTIYYPNLGYSRTYNYTSPSDCSYYQQRAIGASKPLDLPKFEVSPFPTVEPYQYSQEYLDSVEKFNQVVSKPFQPSQFVAPTQECYATWDEYFNAHPNYAPQDVKGTSVNPPCD